jgi:hypothetical protein
MIHAESLTQRFGDRVAVDGPAGDIRPGLSAVVVVAWIAVFLLCAWAVFEQRDAS